MKGIYLINIQGTDYYKIGSAKNPKKRLKQLQTACPHCLILTSVYITDIPNTLEGTLHRIMSPKKATVDEKLLGEWFELDNFDVKDFLKGCKKIEEGIKFIEKNSTINKTFR